MAELAQETTPTVQPKLTPAQKFELITQNLDDGSKDRSKTGEVLGGDRLKKVLEERDAVAYWGTAPTGRPHLGYFVPLAKIADFLSAGVEVKVLLADVHAFLDNLKAPISLVNRRVDYYRLLLTAVFRSLHLPLHLVTFVVGSSYQYSPDYNLDQFKLSAITSGRDARKAGAEVVKQVDSPLLSGMLYPLLQALDEEYLKVDFQFGGNDQRKIFTYAELYLPRLGYSKRAHLMNPMVPGLAGGKMSASDPNSKIDFLDGPELVVSKIKAALCAKGAPKDNGILAFVRRVIAPIGELKKSQGRSVERVWAKTDEAVFTVFSAGAEKNYASVDELDAAWEAGEFEEADLKDAVAAAINSLLAPIQKDLESDDTFKKTEEAAYPSSVTAKAEHDALLGALDDTTVVSQPAPAEFAAAHLSPAEKYILIARNLTEVLGEDRLKKVLSERDAVAYWDVAPAPPTLGSLVPFLKIADFLNAGAQVKILLDNLHASFDVQGKPIPDPDQRAEHCRFIITALLRSLRLPLDRVSFVLGSSFQLSPEYNLDQYKLAATTVERASAEVYLEEIKTEDKLRVLLHPLLQTVNDEYMKADFRLGNAQQNTLFAFSENHLSTLGYPTLSHLMHPVVAAPEISFLDSHADVKRKLKGVFCAEGEVEGNGVLAIVRHMLVPIGALFLEQGRGGDRVWADEESAIITIKGDPKFGGATVHYASADELDKAFAAKEVHPGDLKTAVTNAVIALLAPIQEDLGKDVEFAKVTGEAYPVVVKVVKVKGGKKPTPEQEQKKKEREQKSALGETKGLKEALPEVVA